LLPTPAHALPTHLLEVIGLLGLAQVKARQPVVGIGGDVGVHHVQQHLGRKERRGGKKGGWKAGGRTEWREKTGREMKTKQRSRHIYHILYAT
jgi:hypothetical protein